MEIIKYRVGFTYIDMSQIIPLDVLVRQFELDLEEMLEALAYGDMNTTVEEWNRIESIFLRKKSRLLTTINVIVERVKSIYPIDLLKPVASKANDLINWLKEPSVPWSSQSFKQKLPEIASEFLSAVKTLPTKKTSINQETERIEFLLERLDERLALGEITEQTYQELRERLQTKVSKLRR